jgi:hypothetical protein
MQSGYEPQVTSYGSPVSSRVCERLVPHRKGAERFGHPTYFFESLSANCDAEGFRLLRGRL